MRAEEKLLENGCDGTIFLINPSYDDALIGVTSDECAVYDYELMVQWLIKQDGMTAEEAADWINYNTLRALPYMGEGAPVIMYRFREK